MLSIKRLTTIEDFVALREAWDSVLAHSENNSIFLTWEWMKSWWDSFGGKNGLCILVGCSDRDGIVGIAPFMLVTRYFFGLPVRSLRFISSGEEAVPEYLNLIIRKGYEEEFVRALFSYLDGMRGEWDVISLGDMRKDAAILDLVGLAARQRYRYSIRVTGECTYIELPPTWENYLDTLSKKSRYNISKKERNLAHAYTVDFRILTEDGELDAAMAKLSELHRKRMETKNSAGVSTKPEFWIFQKKIAKEFFRKGWLVMGILKAGGSVVACQYAYRYENMLYHYQSGMDPEYSKFSVGLVSNAYMIREAIRSGLKEYDFLRGKERYKAHWAKRTRNNIELCLWNTTMRAKVSLLQHYGVKLCKAMKRSIYTLAYIRKARKHQAAQDGAPLRG